MLEVGVYYRDMFVWIAGIKGEDLYELYIPLF